MTRLAGIVVAGALLAAPAAASAASPLRPPSVGERASMFRWADRHPGAAGPSSAVNRICVHRLRSRQAVVHFADVEAGRRTVLLRRRGRGWLRSDGGSVREALLRRSCALRPTPTEPAVDGSTVLAAGRFGPLRLGMTYGGAQWATRTQLVRDELFNPPCQTFGVRGLGTSFFGLTTRSVVRRLSIGRGLLATGEGLAIGDSEARVVEIYGQPDRRRPDPFIPGGEELIYDTTVRRKAPRLRIVTTDGDDRAVEVTVGFTPEVNFSEGCA